MSSHKRRTHPAKYLQMPKQSKGRKLPQGKKVSKEIYEKKLRQSEKWNSGYTQLTGTGRVGNR